MLAVHNLDNQISQERYLGPARVLSADDGQVQVELPDGTRTVVIMALALPYRPVADDELLVIGEAQRCYAVGVLHGNGVTRLAVAGDIDVHAVGGTLRLHGDRGVQLHGEAVDIEARSLRMRVENVRQKFATLYRHVRGMCNTRAGRSHALADETAHSQARRTVILSEETVTVNGRRIQIG